MRESKNSLRFKPEPFHRSLIVGYELGMFHIGDQCGIARDVTICAPTGSGKTLVGDYSCSWLFTRRFM